MKCKYLEKKIELSPDEPGTLTSGHIELTYYFLESDLAELEETDESKVYGFEIVKRASEKEVEVKSVANFSHCREDAKRVLDKLVNNAVTPVELPFILDDMIGI